MYLWDSLCVVFRRWYLVLPALVLTLGLAFEMTQIIAPTYQATGSVLFLVPSTVNGTATPLNPYLNLGSTGSMADVTGQIVMSDAVAQKVAAAGGTGSYTVALSPTTNAPVLDITAKSKNSAQTLATLNAVLAQIKAVLASVQDTSGAPTASLIYSDVITKTLTPVKLRGSQERALVGVAALGIVLSISLAFIVEAISRRRRDGDAVPSSRVLADREAYARDGSS